MGGSGGWEDGLELVREQFLEVRLRNDDMGGGEMNDGGHRPLLLLLVHRMDSWVGAE